MAASSTEYLVNISAEMEGDNAAAELDRIAEALEGAGRGAPLLDGALKQVTSALEGTGAAAQSAADAVKAAEAAYRQSETGADRAAKAAERLSQQLEKARAAQAKIANTGDSVNVAQYQRAAAKVAELAARQQEAAAKATALSAALKTEGAALDTLRSKAQAAAQAHDRMGQSAQRLQGASNLAAKRVQAGAQKSTLSIDQLGQSFGDMGATGLQGGLMAARGLMQLAGAAGPALALLAPVALVTAVSFMFAKLVVKLAEVGLKYAEMGRNARLATDALEATYPALAGLDAMLESTRRSTGLATTKLQSLAKQLAEAGVKAADMPAALKAAAMAEQALGEGGAQKLIADLKEGKKSASELAKEMEQKYGRIVAQKMRSTSSLAERFAENIAGLFKDVNIEPLLEALERLVNMFDSSTESGQRMKGVVENVFQPMVSAAVTLIGWLEKLIEVLIVVGEKLEELSKLSEMAGTGGLAGPLTDNARQKAQDAATGLRAQADAAHQAAGALDQYQAAQASAASEAAASASSMSEVGSAMVDGLIAGIESGASSLVASITGVVGGAVDAAKAALGIASPSKVFEAIGSHTVEGFTGAVEDGTGRSKSALESLVSPPEAASGALTASAGGVSVTIENINLSGVKDARSFASQLNEALREALVHLGYRPSPEAP